MPRAAIQMSLAEPKRLLRFFAALVVAVARESFSAPLFPEPQICVHGEGIPCVPSQRQGTKSITQLSRWFCE